MNPPTEHQDWISLITARASADPARTAFTFSAAEGDAPEVLTYGRLDRLARAVAARLQRRGVAGRPVVLLQPPGLDYVVAFVACLYAGAVAVPVYPPTRRPRSVERLAGIVADCGADLALTTSRIRERLLPGDPDGLLMDTLRLEATDAVPEDEADRWLPPAVTADTTAFLQYTSGSTSTPRGVLLSHGNLLHNSGLIQRAFRTTEHTVGMSWLPLFHDMGLIGGMLQPLYYGGSCALMSPASFSQDPLRWLREISRTGATVSGGPNFAYDLCADLVTPEALDGLDLSRWEVAFNGAEPIRAETLERFSTAFAPAGFRAEAFTPCYGLAEATLIVTCKPHGGAPALLAPELAPAGPDGRPVSSYALVGSGRPDPEQRLEIVDPHTLLRVPEGAVGEVWVSGPSVADGYRNRPGLSEDTFRARLADDGPDGAAFLRTGDLGALRDGELFVTGRLKDLIVVRGRNHYPQDIERTVESVHPALRTNCGAAVQVEHEGTEHVVVVHEVARDHQDGDLAALARQVRTAVADEHGVRPLAVVLIRAATLPRTSSGKVQRHACAAAWLDGDLTVLAAEGHVPLAPGTAAPATGTPAPAPATPAEDLRALPAELRPGLVFTMLRDLLGEQLKARSEEFAPGVPLSTLGLDSLGAVRLRHALRGRAGVDLALDEALDTDLAGLARLVCDRLDAAPENEDTEADLAGDRAAGAAPGDHPLARNQAALWFTDQVAPDSPANLIAASFDIRGPVAPDALRTALERITARHAALRSTFTLQDGEPVQRVHAELPPSFAHVDLSDADEAVLAAHVAQAAEAPFDLRRGPLLRVRLFRRGDGDHRLVLALHHLVADLWSLALLLDELDEVYPAVLAGREPVTAEALPQPVFTHRQNRRLESPASRARLDRWAETLAAVTAETAPPADRARPAAPRMRGTSLPLRVDADVTRRLTELARREGTTLYSVLLAAYQLLLARCTGGNEVVVGTPVHGRADADLAGTIGCLVNTVPLAARVDLAAPFTALLRQAHSTAQEVFGGADTPFSTLVERLSPTRDHSGRPLVRSLLTLHQTPGERSEALVSMAVNHEGTPFTVGGLDCVTRALPLGGSQFDVQLTFGRVDGGLSGVLRYDTDLYEEGTAALLAERLTALLDAVSRDPGTATGDLPVMGEAELRLCRAWNDTAVAHDTDVSVVARFEAQAAATPGAPAVLLAGAEADALDYGRLDRLANGVAHRLHRAGVGPGDLVAVLLPRTPALLAALLGVMKSGAAYLPLDPKLPADRIDYVLRDAETAAVVTDGDTGHALVVRPDGTEAERPPAVRLDPGSPAYVIYTSGSTGNPKGVVIAHRSLTNMILAMGRDLPTGPGDGWLSVTTPTFDISLLDYFMPLTNGATVHLTDPQTAASGARLRACLDSGRVTHLQATPVSWQLLLDAGWTGTPGLTALCGGERMPVELTRELPGRGTRLWNVYGPTETTVWSVSTLVGEETADVPLGRPLANTEVYVLDPEMRPLPVGATGELYIGGAGLAHGYLGRPGLTAERFVPHPFDAAPGSRLYRTGDLVRRRADGRLAFVGRADTQVKVHGHRIELGEIEATLERQPTVRRAAVIVDGTGSDARLAAYVEPTGTDLDRAELRTALRAWLPSYAVPSVITVLDALPLTPNGKVNRRALPEPDPESGRDEQDGPEPPRTPAERRIAEFAGTLLPGVRIGRTDDLFELGAHSLVMSRLLERVREEYGTVPPFGLLFESPTVAAIAAFVADAAPAPAARPALVRADRSRFVAGRGADGKLKLPAAAEARG
ncbi:amino acid adenylation domain-containing protein [Streptomyces collinus]|uniref:amino acid adenylation domain-containing protein n=1 Tax=Streptomyces collinus TaxID=42684 RepID=UPI0036265124